MPKLKPWFLNRNDVNPDTFIKGNQDNINVMYHAFTQLVPAEDYESFDLYREAAAVFIAIAVDQDLMDIEQAIRCDNYDEDLVLELTTILLIEFTINQLINKGLLEKY